MTNTTRFKDTRNDDAQPKAVRGELCHRRS
jgi:hypothetical protein